MAWPFALAVAVALSPPAAHGHDPVRISNKALEPRLYNNLGNRDRLRGKRRVFLFALASQRAASYAHSQKPISGLLGRRQFSSDIRQ
jgi:hypothetical protein